MYDFTSNTLISPMILYLVVMMLVILLVFLIQFIRQIKLEKRLAQAGIEDIDEMDGIEFEQYLVVLFKKLGIRARQTKASNDFGADIILEGQERIVIQAKRYKKKVGIKAVQEVNSARDYYGAHEAWVITNNFFTTQQLNLQNQLM